LNETTPDNPGISQDKKRIDFQPVFLTLSRPRKSMAASPLGMHKFV